MHIAYSAFKEATQVNTQLKPDHLSADELAFHDAQMEGYAAACQRLKKEIADIQRYLPGWHPARPSIK